MVDSLTKAQRSDNMSRVRSSDTKPEWILRCGLHRLGFRYRLRNKQLPGRPDLVFPKYRAAVFVHGCYWHRHRGCKDATMPRTNTAFWTKKFSENIERDRKALRGLEHLAWRVMVVWECELVSETVQTVEKVATWLREGMNSTGGATYEYPMADRSTLLTVAEEKVRYRIASYKENRDATDPGEGET